MRTGVSALGCAVLAALGAVPAATAIELRLIGVQALPHRPDFHGTVVGGLSGLDYHAARDRWLAVSDDKSEFSPARCYEVKLEYDAAGFSTAEITGVTLLHQPDGSAYPDKPTQAKRGGDVPDFESVRFDPLDGSLWYASEGDGTIGSPPFVRHATGDGGYLDELPRPTMFTFSPGRECGPRPNLTFEGLTFASDGACLWLAMEGPLFQDGSRPTLTTGALVRLTHLARDGKVLAQFAYPVDPLPAPAAAGKLADNGVSEILALAGDRLLVLERAGRQDGEGRWHFVVRVFEADFSRATDVARVPTLSGASFRPATKRLVLDFASLQQSWVDNLEGVAWGRRLANGHATLVFVSDDNFAARQSTQFWVFEVTKENP